MNQCKTKKKIPIKQCKQTKADILKEMKYQVKRYLEIKK